MEKGTDRFRGRANISRDVRPTMIRVEKKRESDSQRSRGRGSINHGRLTALLRITGCVAILVLSAANLCMGRENDHLADESSIVISRVVEPALPISSEILQNSGTHLEGFPPSQSVAPAIVTADSRPIRSGGGTHWSPWYRLEVGKAPAGYALQHVEFWITGDSKCGSSAECREIIQGDSRVLWKLKPPLAGFQSQRMCPNCGLITSRLKVSCTECGKSLTAVVYSTSKKCTRDLLQVSGAAGQTIARGRPGRAYGNTVLPTGQLVESPDQISGPSDDSKGRPHP